jgi:biotin carboxyl carrier protein
MMTLKRASMRITTFISSFASLPHHIKHHQAPSCVVYDNDCSSSLLSLCVKMLHFRVLECAVLACGIGWLVAQPSSLIASQPRQGLVFATSVRAELLDVACLVALFLFAAIIDNYRHGFAMTNEQITATATATATRSEIDKTDTASVSISKRTNDDSTSTLTHRRPSYKEQQHLQQQAFGSDSANDKQQKQPQQQATQVSAHLIGQLMQLTFRANAGDGAVIGSILPSLFVAAKLSAFPLRMPNMICESTIIYGMVRVNNQGNASMHPCIYPSANNQHPIADTGDGT